MASEFMTKDFEGSDKCKNVCTVGLKTFRCQTSTPQS